MTGIRETALVLFSGGQDSTTCLAWALDRFTHVETIGFDYGQRHRIELEVRGDIREHLSRHYPNWSHRLGSDHVLNLKVLGEIGETALTSDSPIATEPDSPPNTFVPGRNLMFLTLAAALAYRRNLSTLVGGMCETDFSGYPDCRDNAIKSMQVALSVGMDRPICIETPLMWIDKAATWRLAYTLGGFGLVEIIKDMSHTCYLGERGRVFEWGRGCGHCPACRLRADGYDRWIEERE